jgi:alpha-glucuronidase
MNKPAFQIGYIVLFLLLAFSTQAEDGYNLWLRYDLIKNDKFFKQYRSSFTTILVQGESETIKIATRELTAATEGLLGKQILFSTAVMQHGTLIVGNLASPLIASLKIDSRALETGAEHYVIQTMMVQGKRCIIITSKSDVGVLYGVFHFIRLLQTETEIKDLSIKSGPAIKHRVLNHWDNLDRTVERGYAGFSLWDWHRLPRYIDQRYHDYARANASVGINGTVLTNVNANAQVLTPFYLKKVKALADVFRPYGIKIYLTARFSAPVEIGGLPTADPLDPAVKLWWKEKAKEIYQYVPDFGGFLVKANSEGQPGPQNYQRTHADGANMLAEALEPYGGIVMWRAFVYDNEVPEDRAKQAYNEFKPLDGQFRENVIIQVKNGPIDFQPREPFHPLFGAMPKTPLMMEFQITQEYLGFATHLVFLPTMWKECLDAKTYADGKAATVGEVISGKLNDHKLTAIAGVANIGNDRNWCGHPFAQANWYAFGRLAWDPQLPSSQIAEDWIRMTFTSDDDAIDEISKMMMGSRESIVNYMTPLGLHHLMGWSHHYGPAPWIKDKQRADWTSVYYHRADSIGIGFDRTVTGSNALGQYTPQIRALYGSLDSCPDQYLLWFHHVPWNYKMKSGRTLWEALCYQYYTGGQEVLVTQDVWRRVKRVIDEERHETVKQLLDIQYQEACWWRDACLLYFQTFSKMPIPKDIPTPTGTLQYYQQLEFPFAPGIKPKW